MYLLFYLCVNTWRRGRRDVATPCRVISLVSTLKTIKQRVSQRDTVLTVAERGFFLFFYMYFFTSLPVSEYSLWFYLAYYIYRYFTHMCANNFIYMYTTKSQSSYASCIYTSYIYTLSSRSLVISPTSFSLVLFPSYREKILSLVVSSLSIFS